MPAQLLRRATTFLLSIAAGFALVPVVAFTVAQPWHVSGHSMEPTIQDGSVLLVDAVGPVVGGYARGDVVIVMLPPSSAYPHPVLVKRIVEVAGDRIHIEDGVVRVNGGSAVEPYLEPGTFTPVDGTLDVVVPPGAVFVMGDRRSNSYDSKAFGPVAEDRLAGRAWIAIEPNGEVELPGVAAGQP
jgi:signal peptidase I